MLKILPVFALMTSCQPNLVVSDFCKQIETVGPMRLFSKYTPEELAAAKLDRKRANLALMKAYNANCGVSK